MDRACRPDWDVRTGIATIRVGRLPAGALRARAARRRLRGVARRARDLDQPAARAHARDRPDRWTPAAPSASAPHPPRAALRRPAPGGWRLSRGLVRWGHGRCDPVHAWRSERRHAARRRPAPRARDRDGAGAGGRALVLARRASRAAHAGSGRATARPGERVVCANGSLEAFAFVADVLLRARRRRSACWSRRRPTTAASSILQRAGADVVGVPVDGDGIDTDALAAELEREAAAFLYVIPNFQNPSGATMSLERRRRVLELAEQHDVVVVEDDPVRPPALGGETLPTLYELDGGERVMTLSSFTKTVAPGLRIGYAVAPDGLAGGGRQARREHLHLALHGLAGRPRRVLRRRATSSPASSAPRRRCKARCDAMVESRARALPGGRADGRARRAATSSGSTRPGADTTALARARGRGRRAVRQGRRLLRRRRRHDVPAAGVLGGAAGPHPRGHRAPRRGHRRKLTGRALTLDLSLRL